MHNHIRLLFYILIIALTCACTTKTDTTATTMIADTLIKKVDTAKIVSTVVPVTVETSIQRGPLNTIIGSYVDLDANGDNELLIVAQGKDTISYICENSKSLKLQRGDTIRVYWKDGTYRPAGDPELPVKASFAVNYELVKPGKLSLAIKAGMPKINYYYYDDHTSDYAKDVIHNAIKYYLVNTTQADIREEMDHHKRNLFYTVERKTIKDQEVWIIAISVDGVKPQPIHTIYYLFENPYIFYDTL